jgi:hypothetical protein
VLEEQHKQQLIVMVILEVIQYLMITPQSAAGPVRGIAKPVEMVVLEVAQVVQTHLPQLGQGPLDHHDKGMMVGRVTLTVQIKEMVAAAVVLLRLVIILPLLSVAMVEME